MTGRLRWWRRDEAARAAVLVLHGGQEANTRTARPWQPAALRMQGFRWPLARATGGGAVALGTVRYRYRGWNGERADPAQDVREALDELAAQLGPVPVVLLGHSMGGRAALRAAGHPRVTAVVALAPWCPGGDPCGQLAGRRLVTLHGDHDRVTDPADTVRFAVRARAAGAAVAGITVAGGDHAMLRRARDWQRAAAALAAALLDLGPLPGPVAEALALPGAVAQADAAGLGLLLPRAGGGWTPTG
ncbi:alpha/beta hydrolase [Streptomyces tateyamensis]|uniref:alpha/beta hydrolase n=1 Tax=Streptomyces tateyamensis TaxID=565073 RepID=UPI001FEC6201|nr:alpha/beta fold hydrolase [Streptomyces tateyamensis]